MKKIKLGIVRFVGILFLGIECLSLGAPEERVLQGDPLFVRNGSSPEWVETKDLPVVGSHPEWGFTLSKQDLQTDWILVVDYREAREGWQWSINRSEMGELTPFDLPLRQAYPLARAALREGGNRLRLVASGKAADDLTLQSMRLIRSSLESWQGARSLTVEVLDAQTGQPIAARITVTDPKGLLLPVQGAGVPEEAVRIGVYYTGSGRGSFSVPSGPLLLTATRGSEFSRMQLELPSSDPGSSNRVLFRLQREIQPAGYVSIDPHLHTLTGSGHGDASIAERWITLAGEGISWGVATEHNLSSDYEAARPSAGWAQSIRTISGNELTTARGHFNVFPVTQNQGIFKTPPSSWKALGKGLSVEAPEAFVILNHPRDVHQKFAPLDPGRFNALTGSHQERDDFFFHGMEVINSSAQRAEPWELIQDWFALINAGHRLVAIGSSDSHDVARYSVGQARTYVRTDSLNPTAREIVAALRGGRALVSFGIFVDLKVEEARVGDGVKARKGEAITARANVQNASWITPRSVSFFRNGERVSELPLSGNSLANPSSTRHSLRLEPQSRDYWLVAVAEGEPLHDPSWFVARPYQPVTLPLRPKTLGFTNPIWIDADGDGVWTSPKEYAEKIWSQTGGKQSEFWTQVKEAKPDRVFSLQLAQLCRDRGVDLRSSGSETHWRDAGPVVVSAVREFLRHVDRLQ